MNPLVLKDIHKTIVIKEIKNKKRRGRDSNPRYLFQGTHDFQSCPFDHSGTSPEKTTYSYAFALSAVAFFAVVFLAAVFLGAAFFTEDAGFASFLSEAFFVSSFFAAA